MSTLKSKFISAPVNGATVEPLIVQTNNLDRVTVDSSGNVGIGTSSPTGIGSSYRNLVIVGSAGGAIDLSDSSATTRATICTDNTGGNALFIDTRTSSPIVFRTGAGTTERMRVGESGQLGIGGANYGTSGQVLTSQGASSAPVWSNAAGMTLLGTLTTTSGTTQVLSGLTLTDYKTLFIVINNVSHSNTATGSGLRLNGVVIQDSSTLNSQGLWGTANVDLTTGAFGAATGNGNVGVTGATGRALGGNVQVFNNTTSLTFSWVNTSTFDAGTILVYGMK